MNEEINAESIEPEIATSENEDVVDINMEVDNEKDITDIDNMTDEEFNAHYEENTSESSEKASNDDIDKKIPDEDLESLYSAQMDDKDAKLDKPIIIKVKGKTYKVDSINELKNLAELGTNATSKFQAIAEHRRTIDFMQDNGITIDHLQSLITENGNEPVVRDNNINEADDLAKEIMNSPYADAFKEMATQLPDDVKQEIASNPILLKGFRDDVASGLAQKIMPVVDRYVNIGGMTFMQAYIKAGREELARNQQTQQPQQKTINVADKKRDTLNSQPVSKSNVSNTLSTEDIDKMSDAEFERYYAEM